MPSVALKLAFYQKKDQGIFQLPVNAVPCSWTISFMSRWPGRERTGPGRMDLQNYFQKLPQSLCVSCFMNCLQSLVSQC